MKYSFYKKIRRRFIDGETIGYADFIATGEWADGHLAYSKLDEQGQIIDEDEGSYYQVRDIENKLVMVRV